MENLLFWCNPTYNVLFFYVEILLSVNIYLVKSIAVYTDPYQRDLVVKRRFSVYFIIIILGFWVLKNTGLFIFSVFQ